ncbi:ORF2 [Rat cytomegalovirus ALL-03]|uniref:ORF2 n=2 Tax=Rat cytomegalovirus (isolate England) TaxID=1261657 RepID=A0A0F6TG44_RCMVE|nr:eORF2 [Murid betaherpesvirus 8]AFX83340.1 eORF2 [Murid betaherpesvirus 8]AKE44195.1 ORF2 [Rat cytomegalovirus ALL-03]
MIVEETAQCLLTYPGANFLLWVGSFSILLTTRIMIEKDPAYSKNILREMMKCDRVNKIPGTPKSCPHIVYTTGVTCRRLHLSRSVSVLNRHREGQASPP